MDRHFFATLDDAVSFADEVIEVDFDRPESNNQGWLIWKADGVRTAGNQRISAVHVTIGDIGDLNDVQRIVGLLVLNGTALLVTLPCLPFFLQERNGRQLIDLQDHPANRAAIEVVMANIRADQNRQWRTVLVVFPVGTACNLMEVRGIPNGDQPVPLSVSHLTNTVGGGEVLTTEQHFHLGSFTLRVVSENV